LWLDGVGHNTAIGVVLRHEAIGLLVPLTGGAIAHVILRRRFPSVATLQATDRIEPRARAE